MENSKHSINTFKPRHDGYHVANNIWSLIFFNENFWISIQISQQFVPRDPIVSKWVLVQVMAWHQTDKEPLSKSMMAYLLMHIYNIQLQQWVN